MNDTGAKNYIELLPYHVNFEGQTYYLRIKQRGSEKKWNVRYIGKITASDKKQKWSFKVKVQGFTYKTFYQEYGRTLEALAKKVYLKLKSQNLC